MDTACARELMDGFATRTGLTGDTPERRYLWTDAFAVCNFIALARIDRARALVDRVHHVLGQHRGDDGRTGWLSGLSAEAGEAHPTLGGLRIGKPQRERRVDEPVDERREWDRDGQYFHYLTKWMHALRRLGLATADDRYTTWARELAEVAHRAFLRDGRMVWKLSIDLSRPQVASMGQHDPIDGYLTARELSAGGSEDYKALIDPRGLATTDPLGIGGLLVDAYRAVRFDRALATSLLGAALLGLRGLAQPPIQYRLAFRELGLAIGLTAALRLEVAELAPYRHLRDELPELWWSHRGSGTWNDHRDINDVMLATCFAPDGFLGPDGS
jgi:hypothetical protein